MQLPASVQEIADVIGRERALYLVGQLPRYRRKDTRWQNAGQETVVLYVPKPARLPADHQLVRLLGWHDALKLCQAFGGEILKPATCANIYRNYRDNTIRTMLRAGAKAAHVAALMDVSERHVRNLLREIPPEEIGGAANDNFAMTTKRAANG